MTLAERPFAGITPTAAVAGLALALFALWTLLSAEWSGAVSRAVTEHVRVLLYLLLFVLFASLPRADGAARWLVRGVALGALVVCVGALASRVLPDVFPTQQGVETDRLGFPLTYWNALGAIGAIGFLLAFGLNADARERPAVRVVAAAALPVLAAVMLLTFSRAAMGLCVLALLLLVVLAWTPAMLSALLTLPAPAIAILASYRADLLSGEDPTSAAATAQGHDLALVLALCVAGAAVLRAVLLLLDRRLARVRVPGPLGRSWGLPAVAGAVAVVALAIALPLGGADRIEQQYDRFVQRDAISGTGDVRDRLSNAANNGRLDHWRVAIDGFERDRLKGVGAGTYVHLWNELRPRTYRVVDAHSLYAEVLGELGLVGLALLGTALALILLGFARRVRGPDRAVYAALLCAGLLWAAQAGIDWLWEMPAVSAWFFAAGGLVLARPAGLAPRVALPRAGRIGVALGVLIVLVTPFRILGAEASRIDSVRAFAAGDCPVAVDEALDAIEAMPQRAEPYEILAYCDVRLGEPELAVRAMENALRRDRDNWELHYGLALVRAAAGKDPRAAARRAAELNPRAPLAADAVKRFATDDPVKWRRRALSARLPGQS